MSLVDRHWCECVLTYGQCGCSHDVFALCVQLLSALVPIESIESIVSLSSTRRALTKRSDLERSDLTQTYERTNTQTETQCCTVVQLYSG